MRRSGYMVFSLLMSVSWVAAEDVASAVDSSANAEKSKVEVVAPAAEAAKAKDETVVDMNTAEEAAVEASSTEEETQAEPQAPVTQLAPAIAFSDIRCPSGMVGIRAQKGTFWKRNMTFCMDQYEFPNAAGKFPVNQVSWKEARDYCSERGKRLCKDQEWMAACRGPERTRYPYGKTYDKAKCTSDNKFLLKAGANPECRSVYGIYDMAGNVEEWTGSGGVVSFGGSFDSGKSTRCDSWDTRALDRKYDEVGFRCCSDPVAK